MALPRRRNAFVLTAMLAGILPTAVAQVHAPTAREARTLSVPAGALDDALKALARQAGIQVLYPATLVARLRSHPVTGTRTPGDALAMVLNGTGLRAVPVADRTYVLERIPPKSRNTPSAPRPRDAGEGPVDVGPVTVTGTHIPRTPVDGIEASPMTGITRAQIEASGHLTLFELLREQPGMVGHHPVEVAVEGGSATQQPFASAATTSLYALGPRATLFLVDGQRVANYGLVSADLGGLADLASIPLSMVDRVEIMRGGASAIYGADAMAGVVNIILRKDAQTPTLVVRGGGTDSGDAGQTLVSMTLGRTWGVGGDFFLGGEYFSNDGLLGAQRSWRTRDLRHLRLGDWRYRLGYRNASGGLIQSYCPGAPADSARRCMFDPPRYESLEPETRRGSLYASVRAPVGERAEWQTSLRLTKAEQTLWRAPFHASVLLPDSHPDWIAGMERLDYAFFDIGPVDSETDATSLDLASGLSGWLGEWQWHANAAHHRNEVTSRTRGLVRETAFIDAVFDNRYRFGANNPVDLLAAISPSLTTRGTSTLEQVSIGANGPAWTMRGGQAQFATGLEVLRDGLEHNPDALMLAHDVALGPQKIRIDEHRAGAALYGELRFPVVARLQADLALRMDYREGYGSRWSPKLGLKWNVLDAVTLRGTMATGYRAPTLFELRRPGVEENYDFFPYQPGFGECQHVVADPQLGTYCLLLRGSMENRDLKPETSSSQTLGVVWASGERFQLSFDYFRISRHDEILPISAADDAGASPRSLVRNAAGRLVGINDYYANVGDSDMRGFEGAMQYRWHTRTLGGFGIRGSAYFLDRLERRRFPGAPTLDHAGFRVPRHSLLGAVDWNIGAWTHTLHWRRAGSMRIHAPDKPCREKNMEQGRCVTPGFSLFDLNMDYDASPQWRLSFNARNVLGREPVSYDVEHAGYDFAVDDPRGRYYLLSATYRF
ncbi:TonB-dependent receptor domain-containing protein [Lysobacter olei]